MRRLAIVAAHRAAASMQHRRAVRLCRLALLHDPGAAEAEVLHRAAATALASLGSAREAAAHYLDVATLAAARRDPAAAREARRQAADQLLLAGEVRDGVELLDGVLRDVGLGRARGPATALARMIWARGRLRLRGHALAERTRPISSDERAQLDACWSAGLGLGMVDTLRGADYQARFVRLALASGDPALAVRGLALEAAYVATGGVARRAAVRALLAQAASLASTDHDRGWIELGGAIAALLQFEPGRAIVAADRAVAAFVGRAGAGIWEQRNARLYAMRPRWWSGRLRDLAARVRADVADARAHGDHYSLVQLLAGVGSMVWLVDDDLATYWTNLEEARALWSAPTFQLPDYYRVSSEVRGHGYAGDGPAAWRVIEAAWPALERSLILRTELIRADALALRGGAAVAAARAGAGAGRARLHAAAVRIAAQLAQIDAGYAHGTAAALRAAVATQRGDDAIASAELTRAAAAFADAGLPVYTAAARWQAAHRAHPAASAHDPLTAQLTDLGVRAPARFVGMLLPGLD
ncbi:MAG: hypothetical protein IPL61_17335 [Myxococcales bacterium]|nr:hypothetical protein [Myxococcales bacterium]